jgi:predicted NAD/FAD-binding protein
VKIGVIGAGGAGLVTAWLLQEHHDVTLFEKQDRLGGHAHTLEVEHHDNCIPMDAGFEFFFDSLYPTFNRLLELLAVKVRQYPGRVTVYSADQRKVNMLPPIQNGRPVWSAMKPAQIAELIQFQRFLVRAERFMDECDSSVTIEEYFNRQRLSASFRDHFLYPYFQAQWCVPRDEFRTFAAHNVLSYSVFSRKSKSIIPRLNEVVGGMRVYVEALAQALTRACVKTSANIAQITRIGQVYWVEEADGTRHSFDHLIIATNAQDACRLLREVHEAEKARRTLSKMEYFRTTIALHGDRRLMPAQERYWSVLNMRYNHQHSSNTVWKSWKSEKPVFKSWVTYDEQLPDPLYALVEYDHPRINLNHFEAQRDLQARQGQDNLWLAGLYMHGIDNHESAIRSAVTIAERLDPASANLGKLLNSSPKHADKGSEMGD